MKILDVSYRIANKRRFAGDAPADSMCRFAAGMQPDSDDY